MTQPGRLVASLALVAMLLAAAAAPAAGTVPGRNGNLTFASSGLRECPNAPVANIFRIETDGRSPRQLTTYGCESSSIALNPIWSPGGQRILYLKHGNTGGPERPPVAVTQMRSNGSRKRTVARVENLQSISYAPNGRTLAWEIWGALVADHPAVFVGPLGDPMRRFIAEGTDPAWSPDGLKLALIAPDADASGCSGLSVFDAATGTRERVLVRPVARGVTCYNVAANPDWSPDGRRLAYAGTGPLSADSTRNYEIFVIDRDGRKNKQLTHNRASDLWPTWSPNGRLLAHSRTFAKRNGIFIMRRDGSRSHRIARHAGRTSWQALRPD